MKTAGVPLESAIKCATENPAKALGLSEKIGSLKAGCSADILILNSDLSLKSVILRGKQI